MDEARNRIARAEEHLRDLERRLESWISDDLDSLSENKSYVLEDAYEIDDLHVQDPTLSIVIGELIYNLRAALDYLVYVLAERDSGAPRDFTQFPIEDTEEGFVERRKTYLRWVSDEHIAMVEKLQPYKGVQWTRLLRDISNPDKHRKLTRLRLLDKVFVSRENGGPVAYAERILRGGVPGDVQMEPIALAGSVAFSDGTPVVETLEELKSQVAAVIDFFDPLFPARWVENLPESSP